MSSKLLAHFKAMQERVAYYLEPVKPGDEGYVDIHGKAHGHHPGDVDKAFINDMIYLLDGPEQREAQAAAETDVVALRQAEEWRMDIRKQVSQADGIAKAACERAKALEDEVNDLRSRLMTSELAYARVTGYLERVEDERPVEMVPAPRPRFRDGIPDGTMGTDYGGWRGGDAHRDRRWFHR